MKKFLAGAAAGILLLVVVIYFWGKQIGNYLSTWTWPGSSNT
jgi:hypothetical protein